MSQLQRRKEIAQARMLTRRGNTFANMVLLIAISVIGLTALAIALDGSNEGYECKTTRVKVKQGDTVSGIVRANCTGNLIRAIDDIVDERGNAKLMPTEYLEIPARG